MTTRGRTCAYVHPPGTLAPAQCAEGCIYCFGAADNCYSGCSEGYGLVAKPENKGACERCSVENCAQCAYRAGGTREASVALNRWHQLQLVRMACRKGQLRTLYLSNYLTYCVHPKCLHVQATATHPSALSAPPASTWTRPPAPA